MASIPFPPLLFFRGFSTFSFPLCLVCFSLCMDNSFSFAIGQPCLAMLHVSQNSGPIEAYFAKILNKTTPRVHVFKDHAHGISFIATVKSTLTLSFPTNPNFVCYSSKTRSPPVPLVSLCSTCQREKV